MPHGGCALCPLSAASSDPASNGVAVLGKGLPLLAERVSRETITGLKARRLQTPCRFLIAQAAAAMAI
jgi:hypothetical protein